MIVDEAMLVALGACQEAVDWFRTTKFSGVTRREFMRATKAASDQGLIPDYWFPWCAENLFKHPTAIKRVPHTVDDAFRIAGPDTDDSIVYATLNDAKAARAAMRDAHRFKNKDLHHIIARVPSKDDPNLVEARTMGFNAANPPKRATSFDAFNLFTGTYEPFPDYASAVQRAIVVRDQFRAGLDGSFRIYRQVTETETQQTAWDDVTAP